MRKELETIALIEDYLMGNLNKEAQNAFEAKLKTNAEFKLNFELQDSLVKGIERIGLRNDIISAKKAFHFRKLLRYSIIGVIILLGSAVAFYHSKPVTESEPIPVKEKIETILMDSVEKVESIEEEQDQLEAEVYEIKKEVLQVEKPLNQTNVQSIHAKQEQSITEEVFELPIKKVQYFTINPKKDTVLLGEEGTLIKIKANSFNTRLSTLKIGLKEYYKMSDIAFSNLTTQTKSGDLIETGGMIHLTAANSNGNSIQLKRKQTLSIQFPINGSRKEGMKMYTGSMNADRNIVWEEELVQERAEELKSDYGDGEMFYSLVERMPYFPGGQGELYKYIEENTLYPEEAMKRRMSGTVYVKYTVDKQGFVSKPKVVKGGVMPVLDEEALRIIRSLPNQSPGTQRGKPVNVQYTVPIRFKPPTRSGKSYSREEINHYNDSVMAVRKLEREEVSLPLAERKEKFINSIEENPSNVKNLDRAIEYYTLETSNLGWLNCDRPMAANSKSMLVKDYEGGISLKLISHRFNGIIGGRKRGNDFAFSRVPLKDNYTLFGIKQIENVHYICLKEVKHTGEGHNLEFEKVTAAKLRACIKHLDNLNN